MLSNLYDTDIIVRLTQIHKNSILGYLSYVSFVTHFNSKNHQNSQKYFKWCSLLIYIIIIVLSNLYDTNIIEDLTQIYKNCISVYCSFVSFIVSF
jgi:uncharacterized membrane protein affecting hemolysin expression